MSYIAARPLHFVGGLGRKALQFVSSRELPRNVDIYLGRQWSGLLAVLVWKVGSFGFPFGLLLPLAVVGGIHCRRHIPVFVWLFLSIYPVVIVAYLVSARYRVPIVPIIILPAAAGVVALVNMARSRQNARLVLNLILLCAVAAALCFPRSFASERVDYEAEMHYCLAGALLDRHRPDEAEDHYRRALALRPDYADARFNYGLVLARRGETRRAIVQWQRIIDKDPGYVDAHRALARAYEALGEPLPESKQPGNEPQSVSHSAL